MSVVNVKRSTIRRAYTQFTHERLGAVVSGPDGDPLAVQDGPDVVRVDVLDVERNQSRLYVCVPGAVDGDVGQLCQPLQGVAGDLHLVLPDRVPADVVQVVDGR